MSSQKKYTNDLFRVLGWYAKYGLKVIPVDYNDLSENLNPYDFYLLESPDKATSDFKKIPDFFNGSIFWAIEIGPYINIVTLRIIESEGGVESLKELERKYGGLPKTATISIRSIEEHIGYDYLFKCDRDWLNSQISSIPSEFFEYSKHLHLEQLDTYTRMLVTENPYYRGHSLKQKKIAPGVSIILDGFIVVPPSQMYSWHNSKFMRNLPNIPIEIVGTILNNQ